MKAKTGRVVHITQPKSGSQWVRDVLTAAEVRSISGYSNATVSMTVEGDSLPAIHAGCFGGPIYNFNRSAWEGWRSEGDLAVIVMRDPRDLLVSFMHSLMFSHSTASTLGGLSVKPAREQLLGMSTDANRLESLFPALVAMRGWYLSWAGNVGLSTKLVKYEDLIADQLGVFSEIVAWLGWSVPAEVLEVVVNRLSFSKRSGRAPGDADQFSHFRKGVAGDWRNYFPLELGRLFEETHPGLLVATGYETDHDWWRDLPTDFATEASDAGDAANREVANLKQLLEIVERRNTHVEVELVEKEAVITQLALVAQERLDLIQSMDGEN